MIFLVVLFLVSFCLLAESQMKIVQPVFLRWILSVVLSFSVSSILFTISVFVNLPFIGFLVILLFASMGSILYWLKFRDPVLNFRFKIDNTLLAFLAITLVSTYLFMEAAQRWGNWDAWAIWNQHAKFLIESDHWSNLFTARLSWSHPDYPLMLSGLVAVVWKALGSSNVLVPIVIAYAVFICITSIFYASARSKAEKMLGLIGLLILILDANFMSKVSSQCADSLLSLYILIPITLLMTSPKKSKELYFIIGLFASLGIWVKNEGLIFFVFFSLLMVLINYKQREMIFSYLKAIIPMLLLYVFFKSVYATSNNLVASQGASTLDKLLTLERYQIIWNYLVTTIGKQYLLLPVFLIIIAFARPSKLVIGVTAVLIVTFSIYLAAYLVSPYGIEWHMKTSLGRLIHQLYPSFLFLTLFCINRILVVGKASPV